MVPANSYAFRPAGTNTYQPAAAIQGDTLTGSGGDYEINASGLQFDLTTSGTVIFDQTSDNDRITLSGGGMVILGGSGNSVTGNGNVSVEDNGPPGDNGRNTFDLGPGLALFSGASIQPSDTFILHGFTQQDIDTAFAHVSRHSPESEQMTFSDPDSGANLPMFFSVQSSFPMPVASQFKPATASLTAPTPAPSPSPAPPTGPVPPVPPAPSTEPTAASPPSPTPPVAGPASDTAPSNTPQTSSGGSSSDPAPVSSPPATAATTTVAIPPADTGPAPASGPALASSPPPTVASAVAADPTSTVAPPNPAQAALASATAAGAYTASPATASDAEGNAFFQWASADSTKGGANLADPATQARINTATLYQDGLMKFMSATPGGDGVVAACAQLYQDMVNPGAGSAAAGNDFASMVAATNAAFGAPANGLVFQIEFGAMGFAQLGAAGLDAFGTFGKGVGGLCGQVSGPVLGQFTAALGSDMATAFHA